MAPELSSLIDAGDPDAWNDTGSRNDMALFGGPAGGFTP